jgi:hypothetical protein
MHGILKNWHLVAINPEKAEEITKLNKDFYELKYYWKEKRRGNGYLADYLVKEWIEKYNINEIKKAMDVANGYWSELKKYFEEKNNN